MEVRLGEEATFSVQATDELLYPTSAVFTVDTNLDIEVWCVCVWVGVGVGGC